MTTPHDRFEPGDGWREVHHDEETDGRRTVREYDEHGMTEHVWVREDPVPSLPTEPYPVPDRYTFSADGEIDELVLSNAYVHLERLDDKNYMLIVENDNGHFHLNVRKAREYEVLIGGTDQTGQAADWEVSS